MCFPVFAGEVLLNRCGTCTAEHARPGLLRWIGQQGDNSVGAPQTVIKGGEAEGRQRCFTSQL